MRENCTYGSEGGEGGSSSLPYHWGSGAYFTLTFMVRIATPRMMKNPQVFVATVFPVNRNLVAMGNYF